MTLDFARAADALWGLLPETILSVAALLLLLLVAWRHRTLRDQRLAGWGSVAGLIAAGAGVWWLWATGARAAAPGMIAVDSFRFAIDVVLLVAAAISALVSLEYLDREGVLVPEYYVLLLFAALGMMLMAGGEDLMVVFLGLEVMSVSVYVLAGINRKSAASAEAALKYFLLGAFASGFLVYGIALIYGATGTTTLSQVALQVRSHGLEQSPLLVIGLALVLVGFGFKVAAVPFHQWAPDVYDGAPTPVTGFMATAVKAAAFAALYRVLGEAFGDVAAWRPIVWGLAAATMIGGNLIALAQRTVKRMLAYSSIAHAGYLLVPVAVGTGQGAAALVFYLFAYTLVTLAAFALLGAVGRDGEREVRIDDLAGLGQRRPWTAGALAICMLSLLGFPGTLGFIGKWFILLAALGARQAVLGAILVLTSVVSAGYYLPVIMAMYMKPVPAADAYAGARVGRVAGAMVALATAALLVWGVRPNALVAVAWTSATSITAPPAPAALSPSGAAPPGR